MTSSQNEHIRHDLRDPNNQTSAIRTSRSDEIEGFMMDQRRYTQGESSVPNPLPQLGSIGNTHFVDFSFAKMDNHSDTYSLSVRGMSEHRQSGASAAGRPSFSSNGPFAAQDGSIEGSDVASPESSRGRGASLGDGYGDDYGVNRTDRDARDSMSKTREERDGPIPPWTEQKTKAGKERKRLPLACIACRRKKIRCSGEKPACKHCLKSRIPCVYKITTRKAAPRTDYMAMLDKRLKRMEERIIRIVPKEEHDPTAVTRAQVKPTLPGGSPLRNAPGKKRIADEAFAAELDAWAASPSKLNGEEAGVNSKHVHEVEESRLLSEGKDALPSRDIQEHLVEVFFDNLYGQSYHLLHKPSFMRKLKLGEVPPVLMLSVCAVSARFSTHPALNRSPAFLRGETWAAEARDIVMKRYDWPNITILTCLLLLALHEFGTCYGGRSWALGGMAIRMAYTLQLHKDLDHDPLNRKSDKKLSFVDREIRRRTMWACFLMDRFISSGTNRPMFMKEETIKAQLPIKEKFFQLDIEGPTEDLDGRIPHPVSSDSGQLSDAKENMGVAAYSIRSMALWGRIVLYFFQSGRELENRSLWDPEAKFAVLTKEADEFTSILPESLKYTTENLSTHQTEGLANQFSFLHLSAQQNILFLNHIAAHGNPSGRFPTEVPRDFILKRTAKALEAAKRISELLKDAEPYPVNTPFAGYCAYWSSSVQMAAVFSKNMAVEAAAKKNLATNVRYLTRMKRHWGAFHWTSEHLKDQFKACADAARRGARTGDSDAAASPIFQYSDWFDRYPHGVSESDFEDPAMNNKEKGDDAVLEQKSDYNTVEEFFNTLSPAPIQPAIEALKPNKRKASKKAMQMPQRQHSSGRIPKSSSATSGPLVQMHDPHGLQVPQEYDQISADTTNPNIFLQPPYFVHDPIFQNNNSHNMFQLDRHMVFGEYAGDVDPLGLNGQNLMDPAGWDIDMGNMPGFMEEPTSAWFVPFNIDFANHGQDADVFNSLGGTGLGYGMGGMSVTNIGNVNDNGMEGSNHQS